MADVGDVNDQVFESEVLQSDLPVIVDFWAEWCAPCRAIAPIIKDLAGEYGDRVKIVKLNVDESPKTAGGYGVMAIPTVLAFKDGVKKLGLFHLNQERTDRQMDDIVGDCRERIADQGSNLECVGVTCDMEFEI